MEKSSQLKIGAGVLGIVLVGLLFGWKMTERKTDVEKPSEAVVTVPDNSDIMNEPSGEESVIVEERRAVDIDAVVTEIESATDGDTSALDEEASDESLSVEEGNIVIQAMGQSYDETSY